MIYGLTPLGVIHTAISLVALASGFWALARDKQIEPGTGLGKLYLVTTFLTAATGLGIFEHGGFGPPHVLSILTLLALAVGMVAATSSRFGRASPYVQLVAFSSTFLFHMIPGFTETLTRLPLDAPVLASAEAPQFKPLYAALFVLFGIGLTLQIRWLRARQRA
ncbi:hypothetical protein [Rivibacter subsaxonicus]|uniref:DUF2306 domain-containing protein n=1 Tax=Rivibacter subsaxonicus TaxID=457575 RepID=A0A4Q7V4K1_9BURK|nr:hypothetical protein [Rivibacter subsaxonicus]RZT91436.1 hypothetical protein EV670_3707 [Rivibacter subsaxonicus]